MRRLLPLLAIIAVGLACAGPGLAATAKLRRLPKPALVAAASASAAKPVQSKTPLLAGQLTPLPSFSAAPGLASLGLDKMRLGSADAGPACRQTCASTRYICGVDDPSCVSDWRQCILSCGTSRP